MIQQTQPNFRNRNYFQELREYNELINSYMWSNYMFAWIIQIKDFEKLFKNQKK